MGFAMAFTLKLNVMSLEDRTNLSAPSLGVPLPPPPPPPIIVVVVQPLPIGGGMGNYVANPNGGNKTC